ncbi:MAG: [protein-PII] uridylyltransferase [Gammaproteobacteria bacterium]|nr:[protein-PII] uridylyltransferase [Gammaproteobacteria bacterium]
MVQESIKTQLLIFSEDLLHEDSQLADYKDYLQQASDLLIEAFNQRTPIIELLNGRSFIVDCLLSHLWKQFMGDYQEQLSLIAVGGYGRSELHPFSDIDILILAPDNLSGFEEVLQLLIASLWDTGLEISHSVRSLEGCKAMAKNDISVSTNLLESRPIIGNNELFHTMKQQTDSEDIWTGKDFFIAKYQEQRERHHKFQKTSYSLEPNIKKSPGTLRDIQLVGWVSKRHYQVDNMYELVELGFLTTTEFKTIRKCENFLWQVRFALHIVADRAEDRLLFDHQKPVAEMLGLSDGEYLSDVEKLMKRYYRVVNSIRELNDMLLQHFSETILDDTNDRQVIELDEDFQIHGQQIEIRHDNVFRKNPACLLKLFLHIADHPELKGIRAPTLRRIMIDRELINNDDFRSKDQNKKLFIQLFEHASGIGKPFVLMKRYGVLKAYLPAFARIIGQMQYDLFHIYTVDEHTLFVLKNIATFSKSESEEVFPLCHKVIHQLRKRDLLYLAALFHDIGKGQGGDHSSIGAIESLTFCQMHRLHDDDAELVSWLVKQHLLMSRTAQRKDITDPEVINQFAQQMGTTERLDYLYLLTVADITATSQSLWNNWKDSLLQNLYHLTFAALDRGLENPKKMAEAIKDTKKQVIKLLKTRRVAKNTVNKMWARFKDDYFTRNTVERIAWQTHEMIHHSKPEPLVSLFRHQDTGATEVFVYMSKHVNYFTLITSLLYEKNLSIHDASLHSTNDGCILGSFVILEADGEPITSGRRLSSIKTILSRRLLDPDKRYRPLARKVPHRYTHFNIETEVKFRLSDDNKRTLMELIALDKPGLLARIGKAFLQMDIELHSAKVVTLGEKVEDVFSITNRQEEPLHSRKEQEQLKHLICQFIETEEPENLELSTK